MKRKCAICQEEVENGLYNIKRKYVCRTCYNIYPNVHCDDFWIENGKLFSSTPYQELTLEKQREACVDFINILLNQKVDKATYAMLKRYINKGYSYLGIVRALEWFYVLAKNDVSKAQGRIGIVPSVYDKAQKYYEEMNTNLRIHFQKQIIKEKPKEELPTVVIKKQKKKSGIDVGGL